MDLQVSLLSFMRCLQVVSGPVLGCLWGIRRPFAGRSLVVRELFVSCLQAVHRRFSGCRQAICGPLAGRSWVVCRPFKVCWQVVPRTQEITPPDPVWKSVHVRQPVAPAGPALNIPTQAKLLIRPG